MSPGANCCSSQGSPLLKLRLWPMGQMIQLSLSSLCPRSKQNQGYSEWLAADCSFEGQTQGWCQIPCPLNLLRLSISSPCCQLHTFTPQYRQSTRKLGFHYEFQQAHESQSHSLGSLYLLFLMQSVKIPEEQHMTLGGKFLGDDEQKASDTLANILWMLKTELEGCSFLWTQTTEEKTSSGLLGDFPPCVFKKQ